MIGQKRDSAWAWIALAVAVAASLLAAPLDANVGGVAIDGSAAAAGTDVVAQAGSGATGSGTTTSTSGTAATGTAGQTSATSAGATGQAATGGNASSTTTGTTGTSTGSAGTSGQTGSASSGGATGSQTPGGAGTPATPPAGTGGVGENGKGVTDDQVRVGFTNLIGQQDAAGQLGISEAFPDQGDTKAQLEAIVAWANANGGIAGRELVPIVKDINMLDSSDQGEQNICTSFREDQGQDVFAAVLVGTIREQIRQCLAEGGIVTLDSSAYPMTGYLFDDTVIDGVPYLWSPSYPSLNDVGGVLAQHLLEMDFFTQGIRPDDPCLVEPCRVGMVMYDFPNYDRLLREVYEPNFEAVGAPIVSVQKVDSRDAASMEAGLTNAVIGLQRDGVSRVLFMGGPPLGVFFQINAANSGYRPAYGVSSFDQPRFSTDNEEPAPEQAWGMRGIGFAPTLDVHDDKYERSKPMEDLCLQILADAGITFEDRATARIALAYCQPIMMLKHVADRTGPDLTAKVWTDGAKTLGDSFQTVDGFHSFFSGTRRAGSDQFRRFMVNPDCYCTEYVSDLFAFAGR